MFEYLAISNHSSPICVHQWKVYGVSQTAILHKNLAVWHQSWFRIRYTD